jgi:hypothetical protein
MSDHVKEALTAGGTKLAVGPGVAVVGWFSLNEWVLIAGLLSSLLIGLHTLLKIWWDIRDRKARAKG